ncbi:hypothetical protein D3C84_753420 [compost metagenome]
MQLMFLEVLQQGAAVTVDDALGYPGGAGGIQNEQRMVEGYPNEGDLGSGIGLEEIGVAYAAADAGDVRRVLQIRHHHGTQKARQACRHLSVLLQAIDALAVVPVAIDAQQQLGLDLPETVEHALHTEVWRSTGPEGTQRGNGQHGHQGFRHIRHETGDPVALADAQRFEALAEARDLGIEFAP